jgi:MFS family permease
VTYRQLLARNADFRRLWLGQVVSEVGDWLNNIAVLALAIELAGTDRQGRAIAIYAVARHLPLFLFGPVAGVVTDRVDRRRLMVAADILRAALALGFLLAPLWGSLTAIYLVGASLFSVSAFFNAAKRATLPNLVGETEELLAANSLSAATTAATIAAGSAVGGLVATFAGRETVFVLNAATFLVSAELIRRITWRQKAESSKQKAEGRGQGRSVKAGSDLTAFRLLPSAFSVLRGGVVDFREGLRYVRTDAVLAAVFVVATGWGLGNGAARALYSIFGARLGELSAAGWLARPKDFGISVLFVAMGLGGVLGAPLARRFNSAGTSLGARMGRSLLADGAGLFVFALMPSLWSAALVLVAREVNFAVWWTAQQTIVMRRTDNRFAGRVFATHETLTTLAMVGSIYLAGASADRFGIRPVAAAGGACIALAGLTWFVLRGRRSPAGVSVDE